MEQYPNDMIFSNINSQIKNEYNSLKSRLKNMNLKNIKYQHGSNCLGTHLEPLKGINNHDIDKSYQTPLKNSKSFNRLSNFISNKMEHNDRYSPNSLNFKHDSG